MRIIACVAAVAAVLLSAGCERESSSQISISISPNNATLRKGESREFTASGWRDYTWSLSNPTNGVLSNTKGDRTTYTAVIGPASTNETIMQILILTVDVPAEDAVVSTNAPSGTGTDLSAQALITHTYAP